MVFYFAASYLQLLNVMVHKQKYYKGDDAVLVIENFLENRIDSLKKSGLFTDIKVFHYIKVDSDLNTVIRAVDREISGDIKKWIDISQYRYICASHSALPIYLAANKVKFSIFEECSGILSKIEKLRENVRNVSIFQDEIADQLGLYLGENENIEKVFCDFKSQNKNFRNAKAIDFNIMKCIDELSLDERIRIVSVFLSESGLYKCAQKSCLLLTQHFENVGIMSWENQAHLYQLLADYFLESYNLIYIKPHPADNMNYEDLISHSVVFREVFPSELIPFVFRSIPDCIATISSTAINNLKPYFPHSLMFDFACETQFENVHRYAAAARYIESYRKIGYQIVGVSINGILFNNLMAKLYGFSCEEIYETLSNVTKYKQKTVYVMDDFNFTHLDAQYVCKWLNSLSESNIVIFLNSQKKYLFFDSTMSSSNCLLYPVEICKKRAGNATQPIYESYDREYFYVFGQEVKTLSDYSVNLQNADMEVEVKGYTGDQMRIKILEGMLDAYQRRLQYYIEKYEDRKV